MKGKGIRSEEEIKEKIGWLAYDEANVYDEDEMLKALFYRGAMAGIEWAAGINEGISADVEDYRAYFKRALRK